MTLDEYETDLREEILRVADAEGIFTEDAFFQIASDLVTSSGEADELERASHRGAPGTGVRIDGRGQDPNASGVLDLAVVDYADEPSPGRLTATDLDAAIRRALKFVAKARDDRWRGGLDEASDAFLLADMINARWGRIGKIRLFVLTNRRLSDRIDGRESETLDGKGVAFSVWDLRRMHEFLAQGGEREAVRIDLSEHGGPIALLPAHAAGEHESYLAVVPGATLAAIYDRYAGRLLEQNVRVFLQARGTVNKGIRETLRSNPGMFFAYNNGITATAQGIETETRDGALMLTGLTDFQIVNGGQTTASIAYALRAGVDLSRVSVQMKLSIVDRERAEEIVPEISRFANTQNKVNAADFFATSALHVRIKEISERLYAPPPEGSVRQTRWFYERARGQFAEARSRLRDSERRKFDLEHPRAQVLTKTDLAKLDVTWRLRPEIVSLGAQKCFAFWTKAAGEDWEKKPDGFNEAWYRETAAKALLWKAAERMVSAADWYTNGLRANTVTYGIAKILHDLGERGEVLNLRRVWDSQAVPAEMLAALDAASEAAHRALLESDVGSNPTEWAKKQACWKKVSDLKVSYGDLLDAIGIGAAEAKAEASSARREQRMLSDIEAQTAVFQRGPAFWRGAREWARQRRMTSPREDGILEVAAGQRGSGLVTGPQALIAMDVLRRMEEMGFRP